MIGAGGPDRLALRDFGHADIPVGVAGRPRVGFRGDRNDGGPVVALGPVERGFEIAKALAVDVHGRAWIGVLREIDERRIVAVGDPAILNRLLKPGVPLNSCNRLMTAKPPLSQTTTIILWPESTDE